jgi:hypothetical protein
MDMILAPTGINTQVEKFSVGIPLFNVGNARTLLFPRPLDHGKGDDLSLETRPKVHLVETKETTLLGHIEVKNDKQCGVQ